MRLRWSIFASLVFVLACQAAPAPQPAAPAPPAEVRAERQALNVAVRGMVGNPTPAASNGDHHMYWPLYDKVTMLDASYNVKPSIAQTWTLQPDGKTWRFTMRTDVKWPDGTALTAQDVVYTLNQIEEKRLPQRAYLATTAENKVVDDKTFDVVGRQLDVTIPAAMQFVFVWPMKYVESVGLDGFIAKPIGSGPYELVEFRPADILRFKKRTTPHAFRKPVADELTFRAVPENSAIIAGLRTGELDLAAAIGFSADQARQIKTNGLNVEIDFPAAVYLNIPSGIYESKNSPLKDPKVRAALNYAINRDVIASKIFGGLTKASAEIAIPNTPYALPNIKAIPYDVARTKQLLTEAGYPNGFKLTGALDYTTAFTLEDVVLAVQADLKAAGIEMDLRANELSIFVDRAYGRNNLQFGDITVGRIPDVLGFGPSRTFWGCGRPAGSPPIAVQWCSPEWDRLMDSAFGEADPKKREELLRKANQVQLDANHQIPLYLEPNFDAFTTKIKGFKRQQVVFFNLDETYKIQ